MLLLGNAGGNLLTGSGFADMLDVGARNDTLDGGVGNDTLIGGEGMDIFVFNAAFGVGNVDLIADFNVLNDTVRLDDFVFSGLSAGTLGVTAFASNLTGFAEDAGDRIIYESDTGYLYFDADGSWAGDRVYFATLASSMSLTNADFFVF